MTQKLAEKGQGGQVKKAVCPVIQILLTHLEQVQQAVKISTKAPPIPVH